MTAPICRRKEMDRKLSEKNKTTKTRADVDAVKVMPAMQVEKLFDGFRQIRLFHGGEEYRLRLTRKDKLILTK